MTATLFLGSLAAPSPTSCRAPAALRTFPRLAWVMLLAVSPAVLRAEEAARTPRPAEPRPVAESEIQKGIAAGVKYLLENQNADGSWGSPALKGGVPIYAGIGSHHGFQVAVTALSVSALIESNLTTDAVNRAIERGEKYLFVELPKVCRDDPVLIYNVWAHAYGIQSLVRSHIRAQGDPARQAQIRELIQAQYEKLVKYESAEGGWGYYDFTAGTQRPASSSTSFVNAAVLVAFHEAKQIGVPPPEKQLKRAIEITKQQRLSNGAYLYGTYLKMAPTMPINRPGGSLGRSQACALSLRVWGDTQVTDQVLEEWLDRLVTRNGWLSVGRKKPIPHESFFQVAGYFFYFGHYYAGLCVEQLPKDKQPFYKQHLARLILDLQEADGSWYDYLFYDYHKAYGSAFAIMTLNSCRPAPHLHPIPSVQRPAEPEKAK